MLFAFALKSLSYMSLTFGDICSWFNYSCAGCCDSEVEMPSELILTFEILAR